VVVESGVRTVPVVTVKPGLEMLGAMCGVGVGGSILWGGRAGEEVAQAGVAAGGGELA